MSIQITIKLSAEPFPPSRQDKNYFLPLLTLGFQSTRFLQLYLRAFNQMTDATTTPGDLRPLLFSISVWVCIASHRVRMKSCETGPTVYRPYPKRLGSLTINLQMSKDCVL